MLDRHHQDYYESLIGNPNRKNLHLPRRKHHGWGAGVPIQQIPRNQKMGWILKQLQWAQSHQFFSAIWKCHLCSILGGEASRMPLWDTSESSFFNVKISNLSNFSVTIYQSLGWMIFSPFLARPIYLWNLNASHVKNVLVDFFWAASCQRYLQI